MTVEARSTPATSTIASMTRCRSALVRATTRQSMSLDPVIVCASSTSGIAASRPATGSCPPGWRISSVTKAVTPCPRATGSTSGPYPVITPRACSRSMRAWTVPRATPSRREASSTPTRGSAASSPMSRASRLSITGDHLRGAGAQEHGRMLYSFSTDFR